LTNVVTRRILTSTFFDRPTLIVARDLLGKYLVRKIGKRTYALMITEVEAYDGFEDKASHASRGETPRNSTMFSEGGYWYVYLCYGIHQMLNVVVGEKDYPAAILIRGVEGASGPGRVTKYLGIDGTLNKKKAAKASGLWIEDRRVIIPRSKIVQTPRIGVAYAKEWAEKPYRFVLLSSTRR
jgi:DNA-3-methyladenine glycosylase